MLKKLFIMIIMGLCIMLMAGNDAIALCTRIAAAAGYCNFRTGSVECGIEAAGLGNVVKNPTSLACLIDGSANWVVACGNPGSKSWVAPGINLVPYNGSLSASYTLQEKDVKKNGSAYVIVTAHTSQDIIDDLNQINDDTHGAICPNPNWRVLDAVPATMIGTDYQWTCNQIEAKAIYDCTLPYPDTLVYYQKLGKFEQREYNCTQISVEKYNITCP